MGKELCSAPFLTSKEINDEIGNINIDSKTLAKATFEQANAFYYGAEIILKQSCINVDKYFELIDVMASNFAFSCELFMKSYLYLHNVEIKKAFTKRIIC